MRIGTKNGMKIPNQEYLSLYKKSLCLIADISIEYRNVVKIQLKIIEFFNTVLSGMS